MGGGPILFARQSHGTLSIGHRVHEAQRMNRSLNNTADAFEDTDIIFFGGRNSPKYVKANEK